MRRSYTAEGQRDGIPVPSPAVMTPRTGQPPPPSHIAGASESWLGCSRIAVGHSWTARCSAYNRCRAGGGGIDRLGAGLLGRVLSANLASPHGRQQSGARVCGLRHVGEHVRPRPHRSLVQIIVRPRLGVPPKRAALSASGPRSGVSIPVTCRRVSAEHDRRLTAPREVRDTRGRGQLRQSATRKELPRTRDVTECQRSPSDVKPSVQPAFARRVCPLRARQHGR